MPRGACGIPTRTAERPLIHARAPPDERGRRGPSLRAVAAALLLLLLAVPVVELWVFVAVSNWIGFGWALLALVAASALGVVLIRREGLAAWRRVESEVAAGRAPTRSVADGALVLAGGVLLVLPGFVTGVVGLLLLLPPVRSLIRPALVAALQRRAARRGGAHAIVIDTVTTSWGTTRRTRSPWGSVIGGSVVDAGSTEAPTPDRDEGYAEVVEVELDDPPAELPRPERPAS